MQSIENKRFKFEAKVAVFVKKQLENHCWMLMYQILSNSQYLIVFKQHTINSAIIYIYEY